MQCLICQSESTYFFSKAYTEPPYDAFMRTIGKVDYYRCANCGFVLSRTHSELDSDTWSALNHRIHGHFETAPLEERIINQPPYVDQAMMLLVLGRNEIIDTESMLDYAAGYGTLGGVLARYFGMRLLLFDPYVRSGDPGRYVAADRLGRYKVVLNSAMFEHIRTWNDLDGVNRLVADDGCLIVHTLVCENVPKDPDWFYLKPPVHTAFHTNRSMSILMERWGYRSSIYCPRGKSWVLLKTDNGRIAKSIRSINDELQTEYLYYKKGFVDYWKGF